MGKYSKPHHIALLVLMFALDEQALGDKISYEEPASNLEDSYKGRYGSDEQIEGPFFESDDEPNSVPKADATPDTPAATDSPKHQITFGIGLADGFRADAAYTYFYSRFVATEYGAQYALRYGESQIGRYRSEVYGPSLMFLFLLANPTILTPFAGVGPAYEFWNQDFDQAVSDRGHATLGNTLVGFNMRLGQRFVLQLGWAGKYYWMERPSSLTEPGSLVDQSSRGMQIRFLMQF